MTEKLRELIRLNQEDLGGPEFHRGVAFVLSLLAKLESNK